MGFVKIKNKKEFLIYRETFGDRQYRVEKLIADENRSNKKWYLFGFCEACEKETRFLMDWQFSDKVFPNYRERLQCELCGLNTRQRLLVALLKTIIKEKKISIKIIYLYEQITPFYSYVKKNIKKFSIIGSEYVGYDNKSGQIINNIRHEDALNLSFREESIGIIVSNDVYEHVPDIKTALSEAYRVLSKNGLLLFTIPFNYLGRATKQRAFINKKGNITHILPEQYHGNPLSSKGSLVFYDFGWDILNMCKEAGFKDAYIFVNYNIFYGYLGEGMQYVFVAEK